MTANSELRFIKRYTNTKVRVKAKELARELNKAKSRVLTKKSDYTTRQLEYELEICECKRIIKEME